MRKTLMVALLFASAMFQQAEGQTVPKDKQLHVGAAVGISGSVWLADRWLELPGGQRLHRYVWTLVGAVGREIFTGWRGTPRDRAGDIAVTMAVPLAIDLVGLSVRALKKGK